MTKRTENPSIDPVVAEARRIEDAGRTLAAELIAAGGNPIAVGSGLLGAALEVFKALSDQSQVEQMLHRLTDELRDTDRTMN